MKPGALVTVFLEGGFTREVFIPFATGIAGVSIPVTQPEGWAPLVVLCRTRRDRTTPTDRPTPPRSLAVGSVLVNGVVSEQHPPPVRVDTCEAPGVPIKRPVRDPDAPQVVRLEDRRRRR